MKTTPQDHADAFIAWSLSPSGAGCADNVFSMAYHLTDACRIKDPALWWEVIKNVVSRYDQADLARGSDNEAKAVLEHLAAGPLEDLLALNGGDFIHMIEHEASRDTRIRWLLLNVHRFDMTDEIWARVQIARGSS